MKNLKKKDSFHKRIVNWFFRETVAESWFTSKELFNNPKVKKEIEIVKKLFHKQTKKNEGKMLALENILWVILGLIFIFLYDHQVRPVGSMNLSVLPYVFFLVFIAAITCITFSRQKYKGMNQNG